MHICRSRSRLRTCLVNCSVEIRDRRCSHDDLHAISISITYCSRSGCYVRIAQDLKTARRIHVSSSRYLTRPLVFWYFFIYVNTGLFGIYTFWWMLYNFGFEWSGGSETTSYVPTRIRNTYRIAASMVTHLAPEAGMLRTRGRGCIKTLGLVGRSERIQGSSYVFTDV